MLPPLRILPTVEDYRRYYEKTYCRNGVVTFDGIWVHFFPETFNHAFFRDSNRQTKDKAVFDQERAVRVDWIQAVLVSPLAHLYKRIMPNGKVRRIALWPFERYVVIIQINHKNPREARFITAYVVDSDTTLQKIRSNPRWR